MKWGTLVRKVWKYGHFDLELWKSWWAIGGQLEVDTYAWPHVYASAMLRFGPVAVIAGLHNNSIKR